MKFIPLHYGNKLIGINSCGFVGVITLWSRPKKILDVFREQGIDLNPATSPIVAFGTLYGNGLPHLIRNLLYNPQITHLVVCGRNRSSSFRELTNFFSEGVEKVEFLGIRANKIKGTEGILDDLLRPELFKFPPRMEAVGPLTTPESLSGLKRYFQSVRRDPARRFTESDRVKIPPKTLPIGHFPSSVLQHTVLSETPLEGWKQLMFKLVRFGRKVELKKGVRKELQNLKVVIADPTSDPDDALVEYGFSPEEFSRYRDEIMDGELPSLLEYTYGNRLRSYFGVDTLSLAAERLASDPESRHQFISLWDTAADFRDRKANPCLVSLFFRISEGRLGMTASYRTHNAIDAWLQNVHGLIRILDFVCERSGLAKGALTVFSHSISLDPTNEIKYRKALSVAELRAHRLREDPHGFFRITLEEGQIVVRHLYNNVLLKEYRSKHAERIQHDLVRDEAISDLNHALYVGRNLALAERALKLGEQFEEA
ncbi:MAG: hypothetical protein HY788_14840 [Deltaproteobacteria bacterium]|nr:hypothetical protein [Deltaproteobacteria bacterium]